MFLPEVKNCKYDWYNWHRPEEKSRGNVTFLKGLTDETTFETSEKFMVKDLLKSGLNQEYIKSVPNALDRDLVDNEYGRIGYYIPYYDRRGELILDENRHLRMYRKRRFVPETAPPEERKKKYIQPPTSRLGDLANIPYIHPDFWKLKGGDRVIITEGEKKAASVMAHLKIPAIGLGGCWNWRDPNHETRIHSWILSGLDQHKAPIVEIVPDGDYRRYEIQRAYGGLISQLRDLGYEVVVRELPRDQKIDDLIPTWDKAEEYEGLPTNDGDVIIPSAELIARFGLIPREVGGARNPRQVIDPNASNITRLMEGMFIGQFWHDMDSNVMMNGELPLRDSDQNQILGYVQRNLTVRDARRHDVIHAIQQMCDHDQRSPRKDWYTSLRGRWDGVPRLEGLFITYCGAEDTPLAREAATKFFVGAVKRTYEPGCVMDYMLIFTGPQGIGKSNFPKIMFGAENVVPMVGHEEGKDLKEKFHQGQCLSFEELENMGKRDAESMKAIITSSHDAWRPPYGKIAKNLPRRCVLYGSTNRTTFLANDPSGYRRYVVIPIRQVLFKLLEQDREQIWAEAVALYAKGDLDISQIKEAIRTNAGAQYAVENEIISVVEDVMRNRKNLHTKDGLYYFKSSHILFLANVSISNPAVTKPIIEQWKAWGWEQRRNSKFGQIQKPWVIPMEQWETLDETPRNS